MTLSPPAAGVVATYDPFDQIGRIRLDSGDEVRFGAAACVGFEPAVGTRVFVVASAPHPLGGTKATIVNTTGAPDEDRVTTANKKAEEDERARLAWQAEQARKKEMRAAFPGPRQAAAGDARVLGVLDALEGIRRERLLTPAAARRLPLGEERAFVDFEWHLDQLTQAPRDPFFFAFGGADGDCLGVYLFPPALDRGEPAPVVHYSHEHDPIYVPLAASIDELATLLRRKPKRAAARVEVALGTATRAALDVGTDGDAIHRLVRAVDEGADPKAAMVALADELDRRGWAFQATQCRYRIAAL